MLLAVFVMASPIGTNYGVPVIVLDEKFCIAFISS